MILWTIALVVGGKAAAAVCAVQAPAQAVAYAAPVQAAAAYAAPVQAAAAVYAPPAALQAYAAPAQAVAYAANQPIVLAPISIPYATSPQVAAVSYGYDAAAASMASHYYMQNLTEQRLQKVEKQQSEHQRVIEQLQGGLVGSTGSSSALVRASLRQQNCGSCHTGPQAKSGFRIDQPLSADQNELAARLIIDRTMPPPNSREAKSLTAQSRVSLINEFNLNVQPNAIPTIVQNSGGVPNLIGP